MNVLGISAYYHDAAASLLQKGEVIAAVEEERFSRIKNDAAFPLQAVNYCVQAGGISFYDIDYIVFYEKPFLKFWRVLVDHINSYPFSLRRFLQLMPYWLEDRLSFPLVLEREFDYKKDVFFIHHHLSHAASAFLPSGFEEAAILTSDAVGEWATSTFGVGRGGKIEIIKEIKYPHSLGLFYSTVTSFLGFQALRGEGKVMGLAGWGRPVLGDKFAEIIKVFPDGSVKLNMEYFHFNRSKYMFNCCWRKLFGPPRRPEEKIKDIHRDIAATLQSITEEALIKQARFIYSSTKLENLCLAGGVFLNCIANHRILEETPFKQVFIQPAAGDAGGALGAALYVYNCILKKKRKYKMDSAYLGPSFSSSFIENFLLSHQQKFEKMEEYKLLEYIAKRLSEGNIVGWFQGRTEWGPRALGNRSILADPRRRDMKDILNYKVKKREGFRPFAPAVLEERAYEYFRLRQLSPFMLLAAKVKEDVKDRIPAVVHIDGTARVQTVNIKANKRFYLLIKEFYKITGVPVILNTSFNLRGEPIVNTPQDAYDTFVKSGMDILVLGDYVITK